MYQNQLLSGTLDPEKTQKSRGWLLLIGLLVGWTVAIGNPAPAQAQAGQTCRDEGNLTICGDQLESFQDLGIDGYRLSGNLTIATRGGTPVLRVNDPTADGLLGDPKLERARFEHVAEDRLSPFGKKDVLFGDITFVNDPRQRSPLAIDGAFIPTPDGTSGHAVPGVFWVDAVGQSIFTPPPATVPAYPAELATEMLSLYEPRFLDHLALRAMYPEDATIDDRSIFAGEYNVKDRDFFAQVTIPKLRLFENAENQGVPITLRITMDEKGNYSGAADGFKLRMAGMSGEAKGIVVKPGEFEAATLEFSKADNPDLPNLDPSNPNLVFRLESLKYKDGHFAVGGVVGIKDWELGSAMRLTNQSIGLFVDNVLKTTSIVISSTLTFPARSVAPDSGSYPMRIEIGAQKIGTGFTTFGKGVILNPNRPKLTFGVLTFGLPVSTTFLFDPTRNFYGLDADKVSITWKGELGGQTGVESSFRIGVNKQRQLLFNVSGGTITMPQMKSGALSTQLAGTINNANNQVTLILRGTARLFLPGNSAVAPSVDVTIKSDLCTFRCPVTYAMKLSGFELKVAGFTLGVREPHGTTDGGFAADVVTLKVPTGINSFGGQINGFRVNGRGDINITGGSFELPPLQIGKISFVGIKGTFIERPDGGYEFRGAGVMPLPGLDPSGGPNGKKIAVDVVVRTAPTGDFSGMGVKVEFSTGVPGIPIGGTGMELLGIGGSFDLNNNTVKIGVSMKAGSTARVGPLPLATINANASLQVNPFLFTANGELSLLIFKVANAGLGIGHEQGFNGGPGFNVGFEINAVTIHGRTFLRIGEVRLSDGSKTTRVVAESTWALGIKKNQFGTLLPPKDLFLQKVSFKGGHFRHKSGKEVLGLKATVGCCFFFDSSVFVDLSDGVDVSMGNAGDYKLLDAGTVRSLAAASASGFSSQMVSASTVMGAEMLSAAALSEETQVLQEVIPVEIKQKGGALFGISYPAGAPILRLQLPNGTILTEQTVDNLNTTFIRNSGTLTEPHQVAILLRDVELGLYTILVDNAPAQYESVSYVVNNKPAVSDVGVQCDSKTVDSGLAQSEVEGTVDSAAVDSVAVTCNGVASGETINIAWNASDSDSSDATVRVSYSTVLSDGISLDSTNQTIIAEGVPLGAGTATWQLGEVSTGNYKLVVSVDDDQNALTEVIAETLIQVVDQRSPAVPSGLQAQPLPGELSVTWTPNNEKDVAGYEIGFGVVDASQPDDASRFVYSRDMGSKQVELTTGNLLDAKLWGLSDNQPVFVGIRVYDISGNFSAWSPLLRAVPWALSPAAWTPAPNGKTLTHAAIEVAFETVLITETISLEVKSADEAVIAGEITYLTNLDEQVVGLHFQPSVALIDGMSYTVTLKGGAGGIQASDGRQMMADYTWRFTAESLKTYLPVISR